MICVSPIHLGDTMWIRISRQSLSICVSLGKASAFVCPANYYLSLYMASKCIIDSKLTDDSELVRGYTYHCDRRSVICVSPIHLGDTMWIRISRQSLSICVSLGKASAFVCPANYYLSLYMASKCIIDSKLTDDSELLGG